MLALEDDELKAKLLEMKKSMAQAVLEKDKKLAETLNG